jgi:hypothetical protein
MVCAGRWLEKRVHASVILVCTVMRHKNGMNGIAFCTIPSSTCETVGDGCKVTWLVDEGVTMISRRMEPGHGEQRFQRMMVLHHRWSLYSHCFVTSRDGFGVQRYGMPRVTLKQLHQLSRTWSSLPGTTRNKTETFPIDGR